MKPCPFCGGDAELHQTYHLLHQTHHQGSAWFAWCANDECPVKPMTNDYETCVEAIAVWNHRAERTCEWKVKHYGPMFTVFECSVCGFKRYEPLAIRGYAELEPNYCPNCGARVVE